MRYLLHDDGRYVKIGDKVTSFRGEKATVTGWPHDGRNKVWVRWDDAECGSEYYPTVFDLKWEA
jgi:hypothetical protein